MSRAQNVRQHPIRYNAISFVNEITVVSLWYEIHSLLIEESHIKSLCNFQIFEKEYILYILELTYDLPLNEFCFVKNVFENL